MDAILWTSETSSRSCSSEASPEMDTWWVTPVETVGSSPSKPPVAETSTLLTRIPRSAAKAWRSLNTQPATAKWSR